MKTDRETDQSWIANDPFECGIKARDKYFVAWKTFGHVPREILRYVYFFIKREAGVVNGLLKSLNYMSSPIPSVCLEVLLISTFSCSNELILDTLKGFVETFYPYDFTGLVADIVNDVESHFEINLDVEAPTEELLKYQMIAMLSVLVMRQQESCCKRKIVF